MSADISVLRPKEAVHLDVARLAQLYSEHGVAEAEDMMGRAVGELALLLAAMVRKYAEGDLRDFERQLQSLRRMANHVGMPALAQATRAVATCLKRGDPAALAATWARCLRIGEGSLEAEWNARGLSG